MLAGAPSDLVVMLFSVLGLFQQGSFHCIINFLQTAFFKMYANGSLCSGTPLFQPIYSGTPLFQSPEMRTPLIQWNSSIPAP